MASRTLKVEILGDANRFHRTMDQVERSTGRMATGFSRATSLIGIGFAALGGAAIVGGIRSLVDEAREAEKVGRQTAAVIKATGGVANVSAKDVDRLSTALSNKVGVDDELIASGANMLLTFKNVRNEVGAGNDVFNQAERAAVDMAAAMNDGEVTAQGLKSANIQLGKALNDPIKGISALTRVGVTFTQAQKDQIKALVEAGDVMGAQKIILKELGSEFGGAAKAASDPWQQLGVTLGNVKERIGTALLPALSSAATFVTDKLIPAAERWWQKHGPAVGEAFSEIGRRIRRMVERAKEWWETHGPAVREAFEKAKDEVIKLGGELGDLRKDWDDNSKAVQGLIDTLKPLTDKVFPLVNWLAHRLASDEIGGKYGLIAQLGFLSKTFSFVFKRAVEEFRPVVSAILTGNHKIIASAATVAEALHLPQAKALRKAEQRMGAFVADFNRELNKLDDENTKITANFGWKGLQVFTTRGALGTTRALAGGGKITSGTGPTADDVLVWGSKGEAMVPERSASKPEFQAWAASEHIPGFAAGGAITTSLATPSMATVRRPLDRYEDTIGRVLDLAARRFKALAASSALTGGSGAGFGSGSWMRAIAELRREGVPHNIISTFRSGARTRASGSVSFHALNRAVDLTGPNMLAIWAALTDTNPTELIYSGASRYKSRRGWSPIGQLDPVTLADHWSHVHAAYGKGGRIPEDVFGVGARSGRTYGFHGGETVTPAGAPTIIINVQMAGAIVMGSEREVANRLEPAARAALKAALRREGKQLAEQL